MTTVGTVMLFGKPSDEDEKSRVGFTARESLKREIEKFASRYDSDMSEVFRTSAQVVMHGLLPVLGRIPCGPLEEAIASTPHHEVVSPYLKPRADLGDFLLEASGDSMAPKIERGDLVVLRPGVEPSNGEICAIQVTDENGVVSGTLKALFIQPGRQRAILKPLNPEYEEVEVDSSALKVIGVYRGLIKKDG